MLTLSMKYDLDAWPRNSTNYFKFKDLLFGATSILKKSDKVESIMAME